MSKIDIFKHTYTTKTKSVLDPGFPAPLWNTLFTNQYIYLSMNITSSNIYSHFHKGAGPQDDPSTKSR